MLWDCQYGGHKGACCEIHSEHVRDVRTVLYDDMSTDKNRFLPHHEQGYRQEQLDVFGKATFSARGLAWRCLERSHVPPPTIRRVVASTSGGSHRRAAAANASRVASVDDTP